MSKPTYFEKLTDWVLQFGTTESPSDSQFSASQVAELIIRYNNDKRSGRLNIKK